MIRAYVRVSDKSQVDKFGIAAQKETICQWAKGCHPTESIEFYIDKAVSGTIPFDERPESSRLFDDIQKNDIVVCAFASRYSRKMWISAKLLDDVEEKGATVCLPDMGAITAENRPLFYFKAYEAEAERINILKNTHNGREQKRKEGGDIGGRAQPWQKRDPVTKELEFYKDGMITVIFVRNTINCGAKQVQVVNDLKSRGTPKSKQVVSRWAKQLKDKNSVMNKAIKEFENE